MNLFSEINIFQLLITGIVVIISLTFHEFAHGFASYCLGDKTAKHEGRLTLNPLAHVDPFGLIMLFLVNFGWAKPVPINPIAYKNPRIGIIITSIAGPIANFILAFVTIIVMLLLGGRGNQGLYAFLQIMMFLNVNLGVFNLLPIPPLDGSKIFASLFGGKVAEFIYKLENYGFIILFALLMLPPTRQVISFLSRGVLNAMFSLIEKVAF